MEQGREANIKKKDMKAIIVRTIETETRDVVDSTIPIRERKVESPGFATKGAKPAQVIVSDEIVYWPVKVRDFYGSMKTYFVRQNDIGLFNELVEVTNVVFYEKLHQKLDERHQEWLENELPNIKTRERLLVQAEMGRWPFSKKLRWLLWR